jgi:hypothetical protein
MVKQASTNELRGRQHPELIEDLKKLKVSSHFISTGRITKY